MERQSAPECRRTRRLHDPGPRPQDLDTLQKELGLHPRAGRDFLDTLVALGFLEREDGRYANTPESAEYLDQAKPSYIGGLLAYSNDRLYAAWGELTKGVKTGLPVRSRKDT